MAQFCVDRAILNSGLPAFLGMRAAIQHGDTELLLADDWPGPAQTDAPYKVELTSPTIAPVEAMRRLLASLSNGNLDSLSEIPVGTDDIPIGIGPGVFGTINKAALVQGVEYDAWVANLAGRAAYNGAATGFSVLVIDIGDGRAALYFKNSATSGDWSAPSYVTGPVGPAGVTWRGTYSAGTAYVVRDIVQFGGSTWYAKVATTGNAPPTLPTTENTQWILFARSGTPGVVDRGTYSGATAYETNDIVLNNGSTWIALQPTTGNAPPVLPTESNAYWRLLARKGNDETGTGDVVGPAGGVADNFPVAFDTTTGKLIKAITGAIAALHALTPAADKIPYFSGGSAASLADLTAFARTILDDANGAAMFTTMGATSGTGWMKLPNGRLMQWGTSTGTTDSGGNLGISFPTSFSSGSSYNVVVWSGDSAVASGNLVLAQLRSAPWPQAAGFAVSARTGNTGAAFASAAIRVDWIAIGVAP